MIYALGLMSDGTFARFNAQAIARGIDILAVDLRDAVDGEWVFPVGSGTAAELHLQDRSVELEPQGGFFCRIINLASIESDPQRARRWQALLTGLFAWIDDVPGPVVNRRHAGDHNGSKPLHEALLVRHGFSVPESLTTCDQAVIRAFLKKGRTISKTVCGVRARTTEVTGADFTDFEPAAGPVHLQRLIQGTDARIHVVGDDVIAQRVNASNIDYRVGNDFDGLDTFEPDPVIAEQIASATKAMGLVLAGWDFKIDAAGRYWCLEVNPMPGYGGYDRRCGSAISAALLRYLAAVRC
jgi:ribosomal protein S6-L-glutamate ligase RimK-like protein